MVNTNTRIWFGNLGKRNEGKLIGEWLSLPFDFDDFDDFLCEKIGIGEVDEFGQEYEEWYVGDIDSELPIKFHEYWSIDELQELSDLIDNIEYLSTREYESLFACLDAEGNDIEDAYEVIRSGNYMHLPWIKNWYDYGEHIFNECGYADEVSERMRNYFDYESFGEDYGQNGNISKKYGYFEVTR